MGFLFGCMSRPSIAPNSSDRTRFVGLRNPTRTTCHLNTVLQTLYMTPEVRSEVLSCPASDLPAAGRALQSVFAQMAQGSRSVSTRGLSSALRPVYTCTRQQDCHDTWLMMVDQLEASLKETARATLMSELFEGTQIGYVRCHTCGTVSDTMDTYSNLSIAVPSGVELSESDTDSDDDDDALLSTPSRPAGEPSPAADADDAKAAGSHTLSKALTDLFRPEQMRGDDQYECDTCAGKHDAERGPSAAAAGPTTRPRSPRPHLARRRPRQPLHCPRSPPALALARCPHSPSLAARTRPRSLPLPAAHAPPLHASLPVHTRRHTRERSP